LTRCLVDRHQHAGPDRRRYRSDTAHTSAAARCRHPHSHRSEDETLLREAIQAGASGYVVKRAAEAELISAVQAVAHGDMYIHPAMTRMLLAGLAAPKAARSVATESLTQREIDVLRLLAKGYTNRQIAEALNVSVRTIEGHRANVMDKLNAHSRVELTSIAEEMGLLP
jgi:DNA-binding NarL/FixJ family response regulator